MNRTSTHTYNPICIHTHAYSLVNAYDVHLRQPLFRHTSKLKPIQWQSDAPNRRAHTHRHTHTGTGMCVHIYTVYMRTHMQIHWPKIPHNNQPRDSGKKGGEGGGDRRCTCPSSKLYICIHTVWSYDMLTCVYTHTYIRYKKRVVQATMYTCCRTWGSLSIVAQGPLFLNRKNGDRWTCSITWCSICYAHTMHCTLHMHMHTYI